VLLGCGMMVDCLVNLWWIDEFGEETKTKSGFETGFLQIWVVYLFLFFWTFMFD
jgi:hypothetical protein